MEPRSATPPKRSPRAGKASSSKPLLTSAKRRELLENRVQGIVELVNNRAKTAAELNDTKAAAVDAGTAFILDMNKDDLVRVYCQAAEQNNTFARALDQTLTGGIWGELIAVTLVTLVGIGLVRGWIDPSQLPKPIRAFLPDSMFTPPPPSQEVKEEAARQAAGNNGTPADEAKAAEEAKPPPKKPSRSKRGSGTKPGKGKGASS